MKEELPQGDFHIQEERRLFYVALTRAQERLTITTVTEKKNKVPVFIEDLVMDPAVKRRDIFLSAPRVKKKELPESGSADSKGELFPASEAPPKSSRASRNGQRPFIPPCPSH